MKPDINYPLSKKAVVTKPHDIMEVRVSAHDINSLQALGSK